VVTPITITMLSSIKKLLDKSNDEEKVTVQISFSVNVVEGGVSFPINYKLSDDFENIKSIFLKHFKSVCPNEKAQMIMQHDKPRTLTQQLDYLEKYVAASPDEGGLADTMIYYSINNEKYPEKSYFISYFTDDTRNFSVDLSQAQIAAMKELDTLKA
jgi:hypothetical protein